MTLDPHALTRQQRRLAPHGVPWLHAAVVQDMDERLGWIKRTPQRIAVWEGWLGGGDDLLAARYPQAERLLIEPDPSCAQAAAAAQRAPWWRPWAAARAVHAPSSLAAQCIDLCWAPLVLHRHPDRCALLAQWHRVTREDGFLMASAFGPDTLRELRALYHQAGWGPPAPDWADMHDLGDELVAGGWADPVMDQRTLDLHWPSPQALLSDLRALGGNVSAARHSGLRTPRWRAQLQDRLETLRQADGRLHLSAEIVQAHAFRGQTRVPVRPQTTVSVETLRHMARGKGAPKA